MIARLVAMALLTAPPGAPARPASPPCYDSGEIADMAIVALPYLLESVAERCRPLLAPDAFLLGEDGRTQREQLRQAGRSRRASVIAALRRVGLYNFLGGASDDARLESVLASFAAGSVDNMTRGRCQAVNSLVEALSPLPPASLGVTVAALYAMVVAAPRSVMCPP